MNDINSKSDVLNFAEGERPTLSSGLNVLTILTFVGCAIGLIFSVFGFVNAEKSYKTLVDAQDKIADAPAWARGMMGPDALEVARKTMENKLPILLLNLVAVALCLYGAMEMRKLKKQGFILWLVGEILPIVAGLLFIGTGMFSGFGMIGLLFPAIFIILYVVQRKNLVY
jgi:hypothetical protein